MLTAAQSESQRSSILTVILRDENVAPNVQISRLAIETEGYSGSDLHELCRNAAMNAMRSSMAAFGTHDNGVCHCLPADLLADPLAGWLAGWLVACLLSY